jgi:hypothetical protein
MTDTPVALEHNPELAKRIGFIMGHYAALEYQFFLTYAAVATFMVDDVTAEDIRKCFSKFYELRSINLKCKLLLDEAQPVMEDMLYKAFVRACRRMKGAARRRTEVAHCVFMRNPDQQWMRLSTTKREPIFEPLSEAYLTRTRDQFRTLGRDLRMLLIFCVPLEDRMMSLMRALPLPPGTPSPLGGAVPPAPPTPRAEAESIAAATRLGILPLMRKS